MSHHDAMPWQDLPDLYAELEARTATAAKARQFTILTACRTSEVLSMVWNEVDWDARLWTIPEHRMKGGKAHPVPLTDEMLRILEAMKALRGDYVFRGAGQFHSSEYGLPKLGRSATCGKTSM